MKKYIFISVICAIIAFSCTFDSFETREIYWRAYYNSLFDFEKEFAELEKELAEILKRMEEDGITETPWKRVVLHN